MSRGRGIGFFEAGNFHPDFILWLIVGDKQYINFIDPKGLRNLKGPDDDKIKFYIKIKEIEERLREQGEDLKNYEFYLDTRRYGSVPHGGFGLGVERLIAWICGLDNIRDAIPFPRTMHRYYP